MADELSVVIKTKLEIDEQQARQELASFGEKYSGSGKGSAIKLPVEIDEKTSKSNLSSAIPSLTQSVSSNPIQAVIGVNEAESLKRINSAITSIQNKLKKKEIKVDVGVNTTSTSSTSKASKSSSTLTGVDFKEIAGAQKYVNKLVEKAKQFESSFADATAKIASTDIAYKPLEKMWQATVKYEDSVGRTTSMLFSMNDSMEEVHVTQLKMSESMKQQNAEVERTLNYLQKQETVYKDLYSKAFEQKKKLLDDEGQLDDYGLKANDALESYRKRIESIRQTGRAMSDSEKRELEALRADAVRVVKEQQEAKWGATDFASKDVTKQIELEYTKLESMLDKYERMGLKDTESFTKLGDLQWDVTPGLETVKNIDDLNKWRTEVKLAQTQLESFINTAKGQAINLAFDIDENQIASINHLLSNDAIASGATDGIVKLRTELQALLDDYQAYSAIFKSGETIDGKAFDDDNIKIYGQLIDDLDQRFASASKQAKLFNDSLSSNSAIEKANIQIEKLKNDLNSMETNWSKALEIPELRADIEAMRAALDNADAVSLSNVQRQFTELRSKIKAAGADCKSFGDQLVEAFNQIKSYFSVAEIFQYAKQALGEMATAVKEIDSAMTELRKVTNLSESGYDQFVSNAADRSKALGTNLQDYIAGTADFAKVGYSVGDAQTMSESVNLLYRVGDGFSNVEEASNAVIASMAAYGLQVSDVSSIVDKFNKVSNDTSIDTVGLTDAITRSASALAVSGLDLDKSLALIVAGNETTRNAASVGNALKSLSMRLRGSESDLAAAGEEVDEYVKSTSKLRSELKALTGVDIMIDDSRFKDLYDIMDEISGVYDTLSDIDKANVTEILFGKQRASVGASILLNFDKAEDALQSAQSSAGSAMTEHERWMQSIEASEARATAAFQQFSTTVMSSDLIKGVYDMQTGILGFLTSVIEKLGAIPALAATVAGALSFKNIGISKMNMPYPTCHGVVA